jgi:hypothetical protein
VLSLSLVVNEDNEETQKGQESYSMLPSLERKKLGALAPVSCSWSSQKVLSDWEILPVKGMRPERGCWPKVEKRAGKEKGKDTEGDLAGDWG